MGIFWFVLTLFLEIASMIWSYWYGANVFGRLLAVVWDVLFPHQPVSLAACGLAFLIANLACLS
jgi:hypothetical protein